MFHKVNFHPLVDGLSRFSDQANNLHYSTIPWTVLISVDPYLTGKEVKPINILLSFLCYPYSRVLLVYTIIGSYNLPHLLSSIYFNLCPSFYFKGYQIS